jgi:hypothetical protein
VGVEVLQLSYLSWYPQQSVGSAVGKMELESQVVLLEALTSGAFQDCYVIDQGW